MRDHGRRSHFGFTGMEKQTGNRLKLYDSKTSTRGRHSLGDVTGACKARGETSVHLAQILDLRMQSFRAVTRAAFCAGPGIRNLVHNRFLS